MKVKPFRLPYGKYKDQTLNNIPKSYLQWFVKQSGISTYVRNRINSFLGKVVNTECEFKYVSRLTNSGLRYYPETENDNFKQWNKYGYTSPDLIVSGYNAYLRWLDKETYK